MGTSQTRVVQRIVKSCSLSSRPRLYIIFSTTIYGRSSDVSTFIPMKDSPHLAFLQTTYMYEVSDLRT